jgi:hypothetical protein
MESLLRVQKAQFAPPEQARATVSPAVSAIIMRALRLAPSERYQTADEMLVDVERVLRTEFHSSGQTELKLWLEQLARRDDAPSIGKQRLDTSGIVKDPVGTDLSAGTSFELDDVDKGSAPTELASMMGGGVSRPSAPRASAPPPLGGSTAHVPAPRPRRRSGFWLGVMFTLAAVVGLVYAKNWAERKGVSVNSLGIGGDGSARKAEPEAPAPAAPAPPTPPGPGTAPAPAPPATPPVAAPTPEAPLPPAPTPEPAAPVAPAAPTPEPEIADNRPTDDKPVAAPPTAGPGKDEDDDPDEEALLKDAVPNAEDAVIGEEEAEAPPPPKASAKKTPAPAVAAKTKAPPPPPPAAKSVPPPPPAKVETAVLHITSAPKGAIVRTKYRVLGRTPINLHFKTGNTYELKLVKKGYNPATRKVAVNNAKDRKIAVTLKKKPAPKKHRSFFRPHR